MFLPVYLFTTTSACYYLPLSAAFIQLKIKTQLPITHLGAHLMPPPTMLPPRSAQITGAPVSFPQPASAEKKAEESGSGKDKKKVVQKGPLRAAGGEVWRDPTLDEWPDNDYRIFVGDLGNEVNDELLAKAFQKFATF